MALLEQMRPLRSRWISGAILLLSSIYLLDLWVSPNDPYNGVEITGIATACCIVSLGFVTRSTSKIEFVTLVVLVALVLEFDVIVGFVVTSRMPALDGIALSAAIGLFEFGFILGGCLLLLLLGRQLGTRAGRESSESESVHQTHERAR